MIIIMIIIFLNFTWFLFVNKRIYIFSSTLTVILSIVGHITRDVCISLYQFKSSGLIITIKIIITIIIIRRRTIMIIIVIIMIIIIMMMMIIIIIMIVIIIIINYLLS